MADMCDAFREYLVSVKKASTNTVDSYMRDIHQYFIRWDCLLL